MLKKIIISLSTALLLIIGFFAYKHIHPQIIRPEADFYEYPLDEIEKLSTLIIEVEYNKHESSVVKLDKKDKFPLETKTFSEVKVKKVYKGDVNEGDLVSIIEYYAKWNDLFGSYENRPNEFYEPLSKGKTYVLFLYHGPTQPDNVYEIIGNFQGKYVVPKDKTVQRMSPTDMEINGYNQKYEQLYQQVYEKYLDH